MNPQESNTRRAVILAILPLLVVMPRSANAQFLRLGPFDFSGDVNAAAIYTTNVDGQRQTREVQAEGKKPEDLYYVFGIALTSAKNLPGLTKANINAGMSFEKHPDRPDLDSATAPFLGNLDLSADRTRGPYKLSGAIGYSRQTEIEGQYVPGGGNTSTRDPSSTFYYNLGLGYTRDNFTMDFAHRFERERHVTQEFEQGNQDSYDSILGASLKLTRRMSLVASGDQSRNIVVETDEETIDYSYALGLRFQILEKPSLTYTFGYERETYDFDPFGTSGWDPIHSFSLSDSRRLTPTLDFNYNANYEYDPNPATTDIGFTYGAALTHQMDRWTSQSLSLTREPVDTFASTTDSDQTAVVYSIRRQDLFISGLGAAFSVGYEHTIPTDGPTEDVLMYNFSLDHAHIMTRRLNRTISYNYSREESNLEYLPLEEHILTLDFQYKL